MKKLLKIGLLIFVCFIVISGAVIFYLSRGLEAGSELEITSVDLSRLEDGIYTGSYEGGRWSNELEVEIKDHQIVSINIIDDLSFSLLEVREEIFQRLQEEQRLDIDVVSGSTVSSKAYIKAVEDALQ